MTVGKSIEEVVNLGILFEKAARLQMIAGSYGNIRPIDSKLDRQAHDFLLTDQIVKTTFNYWGNSLLKDHP